MSNYVSPALAVSCPSCGAQINEPCETVSGKYSFWRERPKLTVPHDSRFGKFKDRQREGKLPLTLDQYWQAT